MKGDFTLIYVWFIYKKSKSNQNKSNQIWTIDIDKWLFANPKSMIQYWKTSESSITKNNWNILLMLCIWITRKCYEAIQMMWNYFSLWLFKPKVPMQYLVLDMLRGYINWEQNLPCAFTRSRCTYMENRTIHK